MRPSDEYIRRIIIKSGYVVGTPIVDEVVTRWFATDLQEKVAALEALASRYRPVYPFGVDPMQIPEHVAKTAIENCIRHLLSMSGAVKQDDEPNDEAEG